ncbi:MAG: hypothetical protein QM811_20190 [Pirellulales bacterium]
MRRINKFTALLAGLQIVGASQALLADDIGVVAPVVASPQTLDPFDAPSVVKIRPTAGSTPLQSELSDEPETSNLADAPKSMTPMPAWKSAAAPRTIDMRISDVPVEEGPQAAPPMPANTPLPRSRVAATIKPVAPRSESMNIDAALPPFGEQSPTAAPAPVVAQPAQRRAVAPTPAEPEAAPPRAKSAVTQKPLLDEPEDRSSVEIVRERYPNTMVKVERQVKQNENGDFVNHGAWVKFDEKGRMIGGGDYKSGKREGKWTRWFGANEGPLFSGPLFKDFSAPFTSEAQFENDQLNGVWRVTDDKNRKVCEWRFENGAQQGVSEWYWMSGQVRRHIEFEHGAVHGDVLEYAADGKVAKKETFIHGRRLALQTDWFEPNVKRAEGWTLLAREIVKPNFNFWDGVASFTVTGKEGQNQRHGVWTWWHKNGHKQMEGRFDFDQPIGQFTWWHNNGQKQLEGLYVDGKQDGKYVWWHANGMKMMEGEYVGGVQVDAWMKWNESGKVVEIARYSEDGEQLEFKQLAPQDTVVEKTAAPKPAAKADATKRAEAAKAAAAPTFAPRPITMQPIRESEPPRR